VSHFKERVHNNCLNCNAVVQGRFCHICGQENIEPKESVWHLISHFFQDITHFDGKFFSTLRFLLFRPGHLSREYMLGRRASYLNPIRMYVFTSAIFFLFFFMMFKTGDIPSGSKLFRVERELEKTKAVVTDLKHNQAVLSGDSNMLRAIAAVLPRFEDSVAQLERQLALLEVQDSTNRLKAMARQDSLNERLRKAGLNAQTHIADSGAVNFSFEDITGFATVPAYEAVQRQLPPAKRHGWWAGVWAKKTIDIKEKNKDKSGSFKKNFLGNFLHSLPQMFFLSLPLYAFFLLVLYSRHKKYYYVNHAIFSIHIFCATFIMSFVAILAGKYASFGTDWLLSFYSLFFTVAMLFYQYKALRNFYQQGRAKTIAKFIILNGVSLIAVLVLTVLFFFISLWNV
jgi:hypothetical protein